MLHVETRIAFLHKSDSHGTGVRAEISYLPTEHFEFPMACRIHEVCGIVSEALQVVASAIDSGGSRS